jgi:hypothetical protein
MVFHDPVEEECIFAKAPVKGLRRLVELQYGG